MSDQKNNNQKQQRPEETPKKGLGESSAAQSSNGWKRLFAKRWVSPAIFMAAAAIIVTLMWIYQGADDSKQTSVDNPTEVTQGDDIAGGKDDDTIEVNTGNEEMEWPVTNKKALNVIMPFYDAKASEADREAAIIQTGDTFSPHMGIDFVDPNGKSFDVLAVLSGKVSEVTQHATNGYTVEIEHLDGLVSVYQSLTDVIVEKGDDVRQGTKIAQAGRNDLERDLGVHLHFETRKDGKPINPNNLISE